MQMRGLAMGQRLAPVLPATFMFKEENPVLERPPTHIALFMGKRADPFVSGSGSIWRTLGKSMPALLGENTGSSAMGHNDSGVRLDPGARK